MNDYFSSWRLISVAASYERSLQMMALKEIDQKLEEIVLNFEFTLSLPLVLMLQAQ
jgi:hypothetical protein